MEEEVREVVGVCYATLIDRYIYSVTVCAHASRTRVDYGLLRALGYGALAGVRERRVL